MKEKNSHINVINAENPLRMGFYIPGYGIVIKTNSKQNNANIKNTFCNTNRR